MTANDVNVGSNDKDKLKEERDRRLERLFL